MRSSRETPFRIGQGYDVHRFVKGRKLFLGGVEIPCAFGLEGHSDADAVLHAICDAILGAIGEGDIGIHFPNSDERYKDCSSVYFLKTCVDLAWEKGWQVVNVDVTVISEFPKISAYYSQMRATISEICRIDPENVGMKATTNERMGFTGRGEGLAAMAVALLGKI